jgi:endonuclease III
MAKRAIHSADLGIDVHSGEEGELFKWFLACLLFGKPIQQEVARRTYGEFVTEGLLTPEAILRAGWDKLVEVLDRGHYVRYDFSTATKLLDVCKSLKEHYGSVTGLLDQARNRADLSRRLQLFKGVGPVTARIFLRDLKVFRARGQEDKRRVRSQESGARSQGRHGENVRQGQCR